MADIKQVIYDIERCTCHVPDACRDCSHYPRSEEPEKPAWCCMEELLADALELLKEQQNEIKRLEGWNMTLTSQVEF